MANINNQSNQASAITNRLLRRTEVQKKVPLSTSEIYRRMEAGTFPKPVKLGANSVAWLESEIDAYINTAVQQRDIEGLSNE